MPPPLVAHLRLRARREVDHQRVAARLAVLALIVRGRGAPGLRLVHLPPQLLGRHLPRQLLRVGLLGLRGLARLAPLRVRARPLDLVLLERRHHAPLRALLVVGVHLLELLVEPRHVVLFLFRVGAVGRVRPRRGHAHHALEGLVGLRLVERHVA